MFTSYSNVGCFYGLFAHSVYSLVRTVPHFRRRPGNPNKLGLYVEKYLQLSFLLISATPSELKSKLEPAQFALQTWIEWF